MSKRWQSTHRLLQNDEIKMCTKGTNGFDEQKDVNAQNNNNNNSVQVDTLHECFRESKRIVRPLRRLAVIMQTHKN